MDRPDRKPQRPFFGSGPTAKRPGWSLAALEGAMVGRSHRAAPAKARLNEVITRSRAILGLPLGDPSLVSARASMENLIGPDVERWSQYVAEPGAHLHLYGKGEARPGRKMGHVTRLDCRK